MRITYTAEDGTTFDTEEECQEYEGVAEGVSQMYEDPSFEAEEALGFGDGFLLRLREGFMDERELMRYSRSFLRLAELLQPMSQRHYYGSLTENIRERRLP